MSDGDVQQAPDDDPESFLEKVKHAFNDLTEVKVVTIVGNLPVSFESKNGSTETILGDDKIEGDAIVSIVKLLDGDTTTVIAQNLVDNAEVRATHSEQVATSLEVIPGYLQTLIDAARQLINS